MQCTSTLRPHSIFPHEDPGCGRCCPWCYLMAFDKHWHRAARSRSAESSLAHAISASRPAASKMKSAKARWVAPAKSSATRQTVTTSDAPPPSATRAEWMGRCCATAPLRPPGLALALRAASCRAGPSGIDSWQRSHGPQPLRPDAAPRSSAVAGHQDREFSCGGGLRKQREASRSEQWTASATPTRPPWLLGPPSRECRAAARPPCIGPQLLSVPGGPPHPSPAAWSPSRRQRKPAVQSAASAS